MPWIAIAMVPLIGLAGLYVRSWIKASAEGTAKHVFDREIERVRSEFRLSEERLKADIQRRENELVALREGALSGRVSRMALLDKRRLEAVERVWRGVCALNRMKMAAMSLSIIKLDVVSARVGREPQLRKSLDMMSGNIDLNNLDSDLKVDSERPFITPMAWAIYSAYSSIILGAIVIMKALTSGMEEPMKVIDTDHGKNLIKAILPHQGEYLDKFGRTAHYHLLEEIEGKLLAELSAILEGADVDEASIRRAAEITEAARKAFPDAASSAAAAMTAGQ